MMVSRRKVEALLQALDRAAGDDTGTQYGVYESLTRKGNRTGEYVVLPSGNDSLRRLEIATTVSGRYVLLRPNFGG